MLLPLISNAAEEHNDEIKSNQAQVSIKKLISEGTTEERDLYKELYEVSLKGNETLISSVQISLTIVTAFILALFGGQALYNFKVGKTELEKITAQLDEKLAIGKNSVDSVLSKNQAELLSELRAELDKLRNELNREEVEKRAEYEAAQKPTTADAGKDGEAHYPAGATVCNKCSTKAVIMMDGCMTCLSCGDSKCG